MNRRYVRFLSLLMAVLTVGLFEIGPVYSAAVTLNISASCPYQAITFFGQVRPAAADFVFIMLFSGSRCSVQHQLKAQLTRADSAGTYSFTLTAGERVGTYSAYSEDVAFGVLSPCQTFQVLTPAHGPRGQP